MRFPTRRGTQLSGVCSLRAAALLCVVMPLHAIGRDLEPRPTNATAPLSDQAFSVRAGIGDTIPSIVAKAVSVPVRVRAVKASANVFAYRPEPILLDPPHDLTTERIANAAELMRLSETGVAGAKVRPDLLAGMPESLARLIVQAARDEGVDPNLMLSIARAENGAFDPDAISGAGAIGIMQMLPETGAAYGASDLTDPEQNVLASARFLKVLVDKYANPMLVAAAYNAGEPRVDARKSLPLIRETADYVTRVVGLYTHAYAPADIGAVGRMREGLRSNGKPRERKRGASDAARSTMLVFSASRPAPEELDATGQMQPPDGPVKVREEGSL